MTIIKLIMATLTPTVFATLFYILEKKTKFNNLSFMLKQLIIGVVFGGIAVLATEFGIQVDGAILNVRTSAPITAGLVFGGPAGIIAGIIGGVERWFSVYWGVGEYTRVACTIATIVAGFFAASMRKHMFENKKASFIAGFSIGLTMEVMHMLLVFVTNMSDVHKAFYVVQKCAPPMIVLNALAVALSLGIIKLIGKEKHKPKNQKQIAQIYRSGLMICVIVAFFATLIFTMILQTRISEESIKLTSAVTKEEAYFARNASVFIMAFMEILVFAILFINIYFLTKRIVVDNIHKINLSLAKIASGNLNEQVDVRENEEFASLTDDINSTVDTLKHYISEAEARIDKELEFANAIQHSALPSVFPPYPNRKDFEIFALMDTAKEVGGDFYDFYLLDNDRLGFLIADVSGKGIPAAMFMMTAKTVIKGFAESGLEVEEIFTKANAKLCEGNKTGMFVTAWIGILDLRSGVLEFANAGHNPPLIHQGNGKFDYLRTKSNFILAGMDNTKYRKEQIILNPGDEIFLYTDGVTEAENGSNEMFSEDRLVNVLNETVLDNVENRCKKVLNEINTFAGNVEQFDDITMLSVKLNHIETYDKIIVSSDISATDAVWEFVDAKIKKSKLSNNIASKLKICTDEVFSNILRYSNSTKTQIRCKIDKHVFELIFKDDGVPYDITKEINNSLQRETMKTSGIYLVNKSVKSINYEYTDNKNVLTLTFELS